MSNNMIKKCSKCEELKDVCDFSKNKNSKDGIAHRCKNCATQYRKEHKEHILT